MTEIFCDVEEVVLYRIPNTEYVQIQFIRISTVHSIKSTE